MQVGLLLTGTQILCIHIIQGVRKFELRTLQHDSLMKIETKMFLNKILANE
jgi:hypothetical protein